MDNIDHPVTELMNDHRRIEGVMRELEEKLAPGTGPFPGDFVEGALRFFVEFADGQHHAKEEQILFPAMVAGGLPAEGGPIAVMLYEHSVGRSLLAAIRESLPAARGGDEKAQESVREAAGGYIALLRQHICKEDQILFPMAYRMLDATTAAGLLAQFRAREAAAH